MEKDSTLYEEYEAEVNACWEKLAKAKTFEECRKILDTWPNWCEYERSIQDIENDMEEEGEK